jgi:hypothetical protein
MDQMSDQVSELTDTSMETIGKGTRGYEDVFEAFILMLNLERYLDFDLLHDQEGGVGRVDQSSR